MRYFTLFIFIFLLGYGCQSDSKQQAKESTAYDTTAVVKEGQEIVGATFKTLSSNLQNAMSEGGVEYALQFCNIEAMPLTDSLSTYYDVSIRRASHKPRNPSNKANSMEEKVINDYIQKIDEGGNLNPVTYGDDNTITYHAPIVITNQLCLNCHGEPGTDIAESDLSTIQELYPEDQATGFSMGELRGVWTVKLPATYFDSTQTQQIISHLKKN
jgi:hypothetical protein